MALGLATPVPSRASLNGRAGRAALPEERWRDYVPLRSALRPRPQAPLDWARLGLGAGGGGGAPPPKKEEGTAREQSCRFRVDIENSSAQRDHAWFLPRFLNAGSMRLAHRWVIVIPSSSAEQARATIGHLQAFLELLP